MTTTTIHPTPGRPSGGSTARLFRRVLTCLALLAFALLTALPARAGAPAGSSSVNYQSDGTMLGHGYSPALDGYYSARVTDTFGLSPAPTITADFASSKVVVFTMTAPAGQKIRLNTPPGASNSRLSFGFYVDSTLPPSAFGTISPPVWENAEGSPPVSASASSVLASYNGKPYANFDLPFSGPMAFTKLTVTLNFPAATSGSYTDYALTNVAASFISDTTATSDPGPGASFESLAGSPTVTTPTSANLAATTATLGGNVTADGGSAITERGVVYSLTSADADPLIGDPAVTKVTVSGTTGLLTANVTSLTAGGSYSFKAYATNGNGTGYTSVATFSFAPEIAVEQPAGTNLTSGTASIAFGNALIGTSVARNFTVKNSGPAPLTLGAITFTGANAGDFTVTTPPVSPVAATNGITTFTVTYRASATGAASATLSLPNNDTTGSEAPFLISLTGTGTGTGVVASFASPGSVTGGWEQEDTFTIGSVGTANPGNNWPSAAESPDKATDGNVDTKFLIFRSSNAGLLLRPANAAIAYNRLSLTTANDAPERDPAFFTLYGLATAPATTSGTQIQMGGRTVLARGPLVLPDARKAGPTVVQFVNTTAYPAYLLVFEDVKNGTNNNLTQIAEVKLSQGVNVPNAVSMASARGGQLSGSTFTFGTVGTANPGTNWPAAESPDHAIDGDVNSKFLFFRNTGAGLIVSPQVSVAVVNQLSFWTANDAPERDPLSYAVYGFSLPAVTQTSGTLTVGSPIATGTLTLPAGRLAGPVTVSFTNTNAYASYLVVFPAVKNTPNTTNLTQISEVAFANEPTNAAPTNIALSNTTIAENNTAGATIGTLTATDPDAGQTHTFSLIVDGSLEPFDNAAFTIEGNTLKINNPTDFETKRSYSVTIRATDNGSPPQSFDKAFTVTITDVTIPQTITFATLANRTFGDAAFPVSATGGASGQPVTFSIASGPATIAGSTVTITGAGTVTVRASQAGAGDYSAATPVDGSFTVAKAPQTITFNPATTALTTDSVTLSASGGASGLPVSFAVASGPGSIAGNTLTFTGPGAVVVQASQAGSANYLAATPVSRTITASVPMTAPIITGPSSSDLTATSATLGATVTGNGGSTITGYGFVYSLTSVNPNPLINGSGVAQSAIINLSGVYPTGPISVGAILLTPNAGYSFKAYATNGVGTTYTSAATFTTAAGETITIGGTTVLSAANIGTNVTVPELLTGQTIITGTVKPGESEELINFTLPPGKAVLSGMLTVSNYVAAIAPPGQPIISDSLHYRSSSAFSTRSDTFTTTSVAVAAPTRCNTSTFSISIQAPLKVSQQMIFIPPATFIPGPILSANGSASYILTLEIGDQQTDSTLGNLSATGSTTLSPAFAPATTLYSATIPFAQTRVDLTQTFGPLQYVTVSVNGGTPQGLSISGGGFAAQGMNVGLNTIVYRVCAQNGAETTYTVNITREPNPNAPPTFSGYAFSTPKNTFADVAQAKILARAADADGGTLSITRASSNSAQGASIYLQSGSVGYDPPVNFTGLDTFTVTISDGQAGTVVGTITVNVTAPGGGAGQNQAQISLLPGGNVALLFQGIPGEHYSIQRSTDLQNWSTMQSLTAAQDGTLPFTDTNPPPGAAFYRTIVPQS